jgi:hypothetical protein
MNNPYVGGGAWQTSFQRVDTLVGSKGFQKEHHGHQYNVLLQLPLEGVLRCGAS